MPRGVYTRDPGKYPCGKRAKPLEPCRVSGCDQLANRRGAQLCEKHYGRLRQHGCFDLPERRREVYVDAGGYHRLYEPEHPLATSGTVLLHRKVYYDVNGAGPFPCHWCGRVLAWPELHIDHLNDDPADNRLENLVPSCPSCNMGRAAPKSVATNKARGHHLTFQGERRPLGEWAERAGIRKESLRWRLAAGWPLDRALTLPRGKFGPRAAS